MVLCFSYKKNVTLCALVVLGAFISGVKCIGQSCSSSSDCGNSWEKCCRQTSVGTCHLKTTTCLGDYCSSSSQCPRNSVCCDSRCVQGKNCIGRSCVLQSDCGFHESCCNDWCVQGKDCSGQGCTSNFDCSGGQACCSQVCKNGTNCIEQKKVDLEIIIPVAVVCVVTVIVAIIVGGYLYNRRRQQRLMVFSNVPYGHFEETSTPHLPQPANNPYQQPSSEYTASVSPPQYPLTSSYLSSGMIVSQKASITSPHHQ